MAQHKASISELYGDEYELLLHNTVNHYFNEDFDNDINQLENGNNVFRVWSFPEISPHPMNIMVNNSKDLQSILLFFNKFGYNAIFDIDDGEQGGSDLKLKVHANHN